MFMVPPACPGCKATGDFYRKNGYFKTKWNAQPNPRYECLKCGMEFSSHSDRANKGQKRPDLNAEIFKWVCSGVTLNRIAKNLGVHKLTVRRKVAWLAQQAAKAHERAIKSGQLNTSYVQMDEMETFEHTRMKPLSIALAVRVKTGEIIDAEVSTIKAKGKLARVAERKYDWRADTSVDACKSVIQTVKRVAKPGLTVACDEKTNYPKLIKGIITDARVDAYKSQKRKRWEPKKHDPLFTINHLCARLRADLAPLARKSWVTTKSPSHLQDLLLIYIAWTNGYDICAHTNRADGKPIHKEKPPIRKKRKVALPEWHDQHSAGDAEEYAEASEESSD